MKLESLKIDQLPGINPGFSLKGFSPGINIITGPNAVGKSSLIRALVYLICEPTREDPSALALNAAFEDEAVKWTVRRTAGEVAWERDGRPTEPPLLPDRDQLHCYMLSMEDLLEVDTRDARLEMELRRALAGGFDLKALRGGEPFMVTPRAGRSEAKRLSKARKEQRRVESEYAALRREEAEIPVLLADIEQAREAFKRAGRLEKVLALFEVREERSILEAGLEEFSPGMNLLSGDELERLGVLEERKQEAARKLEGVVRESHAAKSRLERTGLADTMPERFKLDAAVQALESVRRKADSLEQEKKRRDDSAASESNIIEQLGGRSEQPLRLDPDSVSEAESLAFELQKAECRRIELSESLEEAGEAPDQSIIENYVRAEYALRDWLAAERGVPRRLRWAVLLMVAGCLVAVSAGIVAGAWPAFMGALFGLGGGIWAFLELWASRGTTARRTFESTGLKPPEGWTAGPVEACLQNMESRRVRLQQELFKAQGTRDLRRRLSRVDEDLEALRARKAELADKLGFDPALTAAPLDRFVRLVGDYEKAHRDRNAASRTIGRLETEMEVLKGEVAGFLDSLGMGTEDRSMDGLAARMADLRVRFEQAEGARRDIQELDGEHKRLESACTELEEGTAKVFTGIGLEPGATTELMRRIDQLADWREKQDSLRTLRVMEAERTEAVEAEEALSQRAEVEGRDALEADLAREREIASRLDELKDELAATRARLDSAGRGLRLEKAAAQVDLARSDLEDRFCESLFSEAAGILLDSVEGEYQAEHEPEVLREARDLFKSFTNHAFDLELNADNGFMARDVIQQARRDLSELSSATRMQLLLAMRLAWTRRLERGRTALPLFLDEALTTSDAHRFKQVAGSLQRLAETEGRQVVYLAARRSEVHLWESAAGTRPAHMDLAFERFGKSSVEATDIKVPESESLPAPDGYDAEHYAAVVGVQPLDPRMPQGNVHVFHILRDDLPLLHRLLEVWRIRTVGQLENLLQSSAAGAAIPDSKIRKRLSFRCKILRAWIAARLRGHGKPVDRIALEQSGVVSETFMDDVAALAELLDGDGNKLIEDLRAGEVSRFRTKGSNDLEQWLESEGYIEQTEPLSVEERLRQTMLDAAGDAGADEIPEIVRWLEAGSAAKAS